MIIKLKDLDNGVQGIYKLNFPNGKIYIGQSNNIKRRMYEHNNINRLRNHFQTPCDLAIKKYGAFEEIEILEKVEFQKDLDEREQYWIKYYNSNNKEIGYNLTTGGVRLLGENHTNAKMKDQEILDIRIRRYNGERKKDVYSIYQNQISFGAFEKIWLGASYVHIGREYLIPTNSISRQEYSSKANSGEKNGKAKLTKEQVIQIRKLHEIENKTIAEIAKIFPLVNKNSIRRVCNYETWKNI